MNQIQNGHFPAHLNCFLTDSVKSHSHNEKEQKRFPIKWEKTVPIMQFHHIKLFIH